MSTKNLIAYMQEHAAGASAALDLVEHLISSHADTADEAFFQQLLVDIKQDKGALDDILTRCEAGESTVLNIMARISEKGARAKLLLAGAGHAELGRLEALEMLSLGIEGKRALWHSLEAAASPSLSSIDLASLQNRAAEQRASVESRRLVAARDALAADTLLDVAPHRATGGGAVASGLPSNQPKS